MLAVAFDTLKLSRRLESAGFPAKQAQDASAAIAESFIEWHAVGNLVTREDLQKTETALRSDMQKIELKISESKAEVLKWMFGSGLLQILAIIGTLLALLHSVGKL